MADAEVTEMNAARCSHALCVLFLLVGCDENGESLVSAPGNRSHRQDAGLGPQPALYPACEAPISHEAADCGSWRNSAGQARRAGLDNLLQRSWPAGHLDDVAEAGGVRLTSVLPPGGKDPIACGGEGCIGHCDPGGHFDPFRPGTGRGDRYPRFQQFVGDPQGYCQAAFQEAREGEFRACDDAYARAMEAYARCQDAPEACERMLEAAGQRRGACVAEAQAALDQAADSASAQATACLTRLAQTQRETPLWVTSGWDAILIPRGDIAVDQHTSNRCDAPPVEQCQQNAVLLGFDRLLAWRDPATGAPFHHAHDADLCWETSRPWLQGGSACETCIVDHA
ncbi:MAG: hypothetical protein KC549_18370, partial [Myxococcales bacterium]|nr:hypothetical protein [Myxococcales bacterium]